MMRRALTEAFRPLQSIDGGAEQGQAAAAAGLQVSRCQAQGGGRGDRDVRQAGHAQARFQPDPEFGEWLTSPENARFTKVIANRLWKKVFGLALIEPLDELRDDSVCSNPELMKFLERQMVALQV